MNTIDKQYLDLLQDILNNGVEKDTRNGKVLSVFGRQIRHNMQEGFPLLTTKKMAWKQIVVELLWFLSGNTNIKYLVDNDCHIWDDNALKIYHKHERQELDEFLRKNPHTLVDFQYTTKEEFISKIKTDNEFAKTWGDLSSIYGKQWRSWNSYDFIDDETRTNKIDQIANLINNLKTNPDSRRLIVSAWNIAEIDQMALPPCHYGFQVYTRELSEGERLWICSQRHHIRFGTNDGQTWYNPDNPDRNKLKWMTEDQRQLCDSKNIPTRTISLMWQQRSVDTPLGLPFNIASYGLLLLMLADELNMVPEELIGSLGDTHIYLNQIDGVKEQLTREPFELPTVILQDGMYCSSIDDVILENYQSHPKINFPLSA